MRRALPRDHGRKGSERCRIAVTRGDFLSRVRIALAVGAALVGAIGLPAIQSTASAAATTLYVNNRPGADCTDSGAGTQAAPYCTVGAAAAVAQPGQTVEIQPGTYRESLVVTRSGTAEAPITFRSGGTGDSIAGIGSGSIPGSGITVRGASHLRFEHLVVMSDFDGGVLVDGGRDVSFRRVDIDNGGVRITGASGQVTYAAGSVGSGPGHPPFTVNGGSTGTVVTTNLLNGGAGAPTGLVVDEAPDTVVVSNTVLGRCFAGLVVVVPVKDGYVSLYNASAASLHLVVDEFGYQAY
ncbi:hypothetical protein P3T27_001639 [Kitasatospora sp. MAA19]|nr:hypothetical protein [Kitasatospora sp. MAA19]